MLFPGRAAGPRAKVYNRAVASPDSGIIFPTSHLRTEDGRPAPPRTAETIYALFHTGCPTSELAWPYVERLRRLGEGGGLAVVAVSQDDPEETERFQTRLGAAVEALYDPPPWRASEALRLESVPAFARVSREGRVEELVIGFQKDKLEAFAARSAALADRAPAPLFEPGESVPAIRPG